MSTSDPLRLKQGRDVTASERPEVWMRELGSHVGCHGWTTALVMALPPDVPEGMWVKVTKVYNQGGWMPWTTLNVVTRKGRQWSIRMECFEPCCEFSLDEGATWLSHRSRDVREALMDLYCRQEADLEESQRRVDLTGRLLKRSGGDPEKRRRRMAEIEQDLKRPCRHHKPGASQRIWEDRQQKGKAELRRLMNGGVPGFIKDDPYQDYPF